MFKYLNLCNTSPFYLAKVSIDQKSKWPCGQNCSRYTEIVFGCGYNHAEGSFLASHSFFFFFKVHLKKHMLQLYSSQKKDFLIKNIPSNTNSRISSLNLPGGQGSKEAQAFIFLNFNIINAVKRDPFLTRFLKQFRLMLPQSKRVWATQMYSVWWQRSQRTLLLLIPILTSKSNY